MRKLLPFLGLLGLFAGATVVSAQAIGDAVTATGCLAQEEDDDGIEYLLTHASAEMAAFDEIELVPGEGVSLDGHVGHMIEVSGLVIADDDEDVDVEEPEEEVEPEEENELHLRVTSLRHVSTSCDEGV